MREFVILVKSKLSVFRNDDSSAGIKENKEKKCRKKEVIKTTTIIKIIIMISYILNAGSEGEGERIALEIK